MRIGASLLINADTCYLSYNWQRLVALGDLNTALESLDEYCVDEISLIYPKKYFKESDFYKTIDSIKNIRIHTPISFGGGITSFKHLKQLNNLPVERFIFSETFINKNIPLLERFKNTFGRQALIALLPLCTKGKDIYFWCNNELKILNQGILDFVNLYADEIIIYDIQNEGSDNNFNFNLIDNLKNAIDSSKIIITGGVGRLTIAKAKKKELASVLIDNKVLFKENSLKGYFK